MRVHADALVRVARLAPGDLFLPNQARRMKKFNPNKRGTENGVEEKDARKNTTQHNSQEELPDDAKPRKSQRAPTARRADWPQLFC